MAVWAACDIAARKPAYWDGSNWVGVSGRGWCVFRCNTMLQGSQCIESVVQSLIFLNRVGCRTEELSRPLYDCFFRLTDAAGHLGSVSLKQRCSVKFAPGGS